MALTTLFPYGKNRRFDKHEKTMRHTSMSDRLLYKDGRFAAHPH